MTISHVPVPARGQERMVTVFFSMDGHRVRLSLSETSRVELHHAGNGKAVLRFEGEEYSGSLEKPGFHFFRQAISWPLLPPASSSHPYLTVQEE